MKVVISGKLVCTFDNIVIEVADGSLEDAVELLEDGVYDSKLLELMVDTASVESCQIDEVIKDE